MSSPTNMRVFKFGGASVKDAAAVKNVAEILKKFSSDQIVVVVSAMGKTTNGLEKVVNDLFNSTGEAMDSLEQVRAFHLRIIEELFEKGHPVFNDVHNLFVELEWAVEGDPELPYDQEYDQIVSVGELISSKILSHYLDSAGVSNTWKDARDFIKTDDQFREGNVDWDLTEASIKAKLLPEFEKKPIIVTQGFIGVTSDNYTITLGREGSDYSAAIIAYCLNAKEVTIWKDVPGVLNADPKWFDDTLLLEQISYLDAIELAYYGATVIHPKTIKPLQNKNIPLKVKSFLEPDKPGTLINETESGRNTASFIFKVDQVLLSISPKDFSFIVEENLSGIFSVFAEKGIKINLMQNSAVSFSVCIDNRGERIEDLMETLRINFRVKYNTALELITIRYYDDATIKRVMTGKEMILEQKSRNTIQLVVRNT
jgi:aspartate kinase